MSKNILKTLSNSVKRIVLIKEDDNTKLLESSAEEHDHVTGGCTTQTCLNTTKQSGRDPEKHAQEVLSILHGVLLNDLRSQELNEAAEPIKQWAKINGITPEGKKGGYPQSWLEEYLRKVEMSVEKHFPTLPSKGPENSHLETTEEYLKKAKNLVCMKVIGLVNVLEDAKLLSYVVDSYNHRLFIVLEMLMDKSSSIKEVLFLLKWVKQTYLSREIHNTTPQRVDVFRVSDPLLLTGWFEKSTQKLLRLIQDYISSTLQMVQQYNEAPCDYSNEENLIKVRVDVLQCLNAAVQGSKTVSHILMTSVQRVCCYELHSFVQRYVNAEKKQLEVQKPSETYLLQLFHVTDNCRQLRSYVLTIMDADNNRDSSTVRMLEDLEAQVSVYLQTCFSDLAEEHLKKYFKEQGVHLQRLMEYIQKIFATLARKDNGEETKQHIVNAVYQSVTRAYLRCLMQRKCRKLEIIWGDVHMQMTTDAVFIHSVFTTLGTNDERQRMCLMKMSEILDCTDVDCLKLVCAALYRDFPEESKEYLLALVKWKNGLSKSQKKEILDAVQETCQNGDDIAPSQMWWRCCM